ncbi:MULTISPECIES: sensor histidine kinase [unclassified Paenibacillus]|uniref:sensor histidine kinase n=1 Tax=unclassified Paenibacillus TaxID=185978 RepID=UPI0027878623|nr:MULTISPECIES: histidine kinase [unclassified Paenibacillus]MDQ0899223.1 two-component system sensor histidine kinase YesM [Paenibacillus sp. V4I7]MDQ0914787.1 two-component system sensor histidine kinase YesM [Paenibacillus sp. V4I5]
MSIVRKIIVGYIVLIFIPVIVFGYYYYNQIYGNLTKQFVESRQKILEQAYANMKADLTRIQSIHRLLQYNPYVTDYLDGLYESDAESIFAYTRYINPIFTQSFFSNPEIESLRIYKIKQQVLTITDRFIDTSLQGGEADEISLSLKPGYGKWTLLEPQAPEPQLIYYQNIYNNNITEKLGLLEIRINCDLIHRFYKAAGVEGNWKSSLLSEIGKPLVNGEATSRLDDKTLKLLEANESNAYVITRQTIVNQLDIKELGVRIVIMGKVEEVFRAVKEKEAVLILTIFAFLAALSFAYYLLASTITKRILRLARHMRNLGDDNMKLIVNRHDNQDEIGFLINTYNNMINRMDELINNVHRAELRNKEAAYQVLQAQIKPHFLYNTLETIRMLAEIANNKEVANISFWFGKLMRYSLSSQKEETVLAREIETVTFYLNIHKMRLLDRLTYEINVNVNADKIACPRFMLQPLIENSIVHGASTVIRPVHIQVQAEETVDETRIYIIDNGAGIPQERLHTIQSKLYRDIETKPLSEGGGLGLYNVSERIKSFYRGASRLELTSEQGKGTCLTIIIDKRDGE